MTHLNRLVERFLEKLELIKKWNNLKELKGEETLKKCFSDIIEYPLTFVYTKDPVSLISQLKEYEQDVNHWIQFLSEKKE